MEKVWNRTDLPVEDRLAARSWTWGPDTFDARYEPYVQGPGGQHLVSYFDKSRMEINNPTADRNSQWFVTNGLLVVDMIGGQIQQGDAQFAPASPANIPVAGDQGGSPETPTYASLARYASLKGDNRAPNRTGQAIREGIGRTGGIGTLDNLAGFARYGVYEPTTGHNIADVFWSFINQRGTVYENGRYVNGTVVDWLFAMGYPITEPYWIKITVQGQERWVLMQAFQRRILTYSPHNPEGWKVEMGNVGRAYFDWRYQGQPLPATPTPKPAASITINPASGDTNTEITVTGKGFPAFAAVTIGAEKASDNYFRGLGTVGVKQDGTFSAKVKLPADAAHLGEVLITATANAGAVRATAGFKLSFAPNVSVDEREVVINGVLRVRGENFPANASIAIGLEFNPGNFEWVARTKANISGAFETTVAVGNRAAGTSIKVIAQADSGQKATASTTVRVIANPGLQALPNSGPVGVNVTLRGFTWPAGRAISYGFRAADSTTEAWMADTVFTDGAGNFTATVFIGREYAEKSEMRLFAYEGISRVRVETSYRVIRSNPPTPTPRPAEATVVVSPSVLAIGQVATVAGNNWQAGGTVNIGVGRPGFGVEEWLTAVRADGNRAFATSIALGPRWASAGTLVVTATIPNGKIATTYITVVASAGRISPSGLPMTVNTYNNGGGTLYKLNAQGWTPGKPVNIHIVSADGSINQPVAQSVVNEHGIFSASFNAAAPWAGRIDLGVRAVTSDGQQYSLRYAPTTTMVKQNGNTYSVTGYNWPANAFAEVVRNFSDEGKGDGDVIRSFVTDGNGNFSFTIELPRIPGQNKNDVEIRAKDQPYSATFDF
jgi:hypothetical protein